MRGALGQLSPTLHTSLCLEGRAVLGASSAGRPSRRGRTGWEAVPEDTPGPPRLVRSTPHPVEGQLLRPADSRRELEPQRLLGALRESGPDTCAHRAPPVHPQEAGPLPSVLTPAAWWGVGLPGQGQRRCWGQTTHSGGFGLRVRVGLPADPRAGAMTSPGLPPPHLALLTPPWWAPPGTQPSHPQTCRRAGCLLPSLPPAAGATSVPSSWQAQGEGRRGPGQHPLGTHRQRAFPVLLPLSSHRNRKCSAGKSGRAQETGEEASCGGLGPASTLPTRPERPSTPGPGA